MTRKQKILAKIRAWIDRRLPRDVLRVTLIDMNSGKVLFNSTHPEIVLRLKMGEQDMSQPYEGRFLIHFTTEHLSP